MNSYNYHVHLNSYIKKACSAEKQAIKLNSEIICRGLNSRFPGNSKSGCDTLVSSWVFFKRRTSWPFILDRVHLS